MVYGRRGEMEYEVTGSAGGRRVEQIRQKGAEGDGRGGGTGVEGSAGELEEEEVGASEEGGVLCECGFITNPGDAEMMREHPEKIARAISEGVKDYLKYARD